MPAALLLALACTDDPPPGDDAGVSVRVDVIRSGRDLVAVAVPPTASISWSLDGAATDIEGPRVRASAVVPGQAWTVTASHPLGRAAQSFVVPEPPGGNVLVLLIDDIGVDQVGVYGRNPAAPPTPRIDALAAEGVRFDYAYASPVCSPSRATLLTGRLPRRHGVGWIIDTGSLDYQLPLASLTIAEALDAAWPSPWETSAAGKWHVAGPKSEADLMHPLQQGFDWYAGTAGNPPYRTGFGYYRWEKNTNGVLDESTTYLTTDTTDDAIDRIDAMSEPWFLYVAYNAAHTPLAPPPPELSDRPVDASSSDSDLFDATVQALDTEIGRLLDSLDPDLRARTTVVLAGDNGSPDHAIDPPIDPDHGKHQVYEPGVRIPLIIAGPHVEAPGAVVDALVHIADLFPTVLEIAGVPLTGDDDALVVDLDPPVALDAWSLLPYLVDPTAPSRTSLYTEAFSPSGDAESPTLDRRMVRDARYKLIRTLDSDDALFDLSTDPTDFDDGPDLALEPLDAEAADAFARLTAMMDDLDQTLVYDGF